MAVRKRVKRPRIERAAPRRSFVATLKNGKKHEEHADTAQPPESGPGESSDDGEVAYDAINSGYRVIDEYMRQGQRLAEQFWLPSPGSGALPEITQMMDRFLRSAGDMGSAWLEMMTEWSKPAANGTSSRIAAGPFTAGRDGHVGSAPEVTLNGGEIALVVECSRKIRVSVDARCRLEDIEVCPLMASDRSLPPITTVAVQKPSASAQAVLHVAVVDNHPPGAYYGVLLDRRAARPAGAISVVLE